MSSQFSSRKHWTPKELRKLVTFNLAYLNHGKEESRSFHGDFDYFRKPFFTWPLPTMQFTGETCIKPTLLPHRLTVSGAWRSEQSDPISMKHEIHVIFMTRWHGLHSFLWQDGMRQDCIHFYDKMAWDRTASIFMTRWHETGLHPFLWQDGMRQDCIHFYDKMAWDRTASIFMTGQHKTGTHPFLWQASKRPALIHLYDKPA